MMLKCDDCEFDFDPKHPLAIDRPSVVEPGKRWQQCPACYLMGVNGSTDAWAVWNDCQGVFTDSVFSRRKQAEADLKENFGDDNASARVVPVRIVVEPEDKHWMRDMRERDYE